jgi:hypothetical protein
MDTSTLGPSLFRDVRRTLTVDGDRAIIKRTQDIPPDFWERIERRRDIQKSAPVGEFMHIAEIPAHMVETWFAEGFNVFDKNVDHKAILARLRAESAERLIT